MENLLQEYPLLLEKVDRIYLTPMSIFRLEKVPCESENGKTIIGNILVMFTGLIQYDATGSQDFIHCIPLAFYGEGKESLTPLYKGQDVWVEITNMENEYPYDQMFPKYETAHWN